MVIKNADFEMLNRCVMKKTTWMPNEFNSKITHGRIEMW